MEAFRKYESKAEVEREERRKKKQLQEEQDKARKEKLKQQKEHEEKLREALNENQSVTLTEISDEEAAELQNKIEQVGLEFQKFLCVF